MKSKYFREYFGSFSSKLYYFYILGVSHLKSDRPTVTVNRVHVDYFTCHLWELSHLFSVYMAVIIHILHDENQSLLKTVVFARGLNQNNLQPWPYIRTCRTSCHPDPIYGPALVSFRGNVPPWPYILACPSIGHLRVQKFQGDILEGWRNVSETTPRCLTNACYLSLTWCPKVSISLYESFAWDRTFTKSDWNFSRDIWSRFTETYKQCILCLS